MTLGVVTCSRVEAACLEPLAAAGGAIVVAGRGTPARTRSGIDELLGRGVSGLVSFGLGAGLGPAMRPGDLVIADRVVLPSGRSLPTDTRWREALLARVRGAARKVVVAGVSGTDVPPVAVEDKIRAFRATCAALLDGESHIVADVAEAAALPLLVVRAAAEPAWDDHMGVPDAGFGSFSLVYRLAARPLDMTATWRFVRHGRTGLETLQRVAALLPEPQLPAAA